jgi:broad specificity phosphatase PhoE/predicted kinase
MGIRDTQPLVLAMVGLPARGKTYIARKLARYLSFIGYSARVFNVGSYRRERLGSQQPASFFDPDNSEGRQILFGLAREALDDACQFLATGGNVAIYDATNSTRMRRDYVRKHLAERGVSLVFVESRCDDPSVVEANVRETKLHMPDYQGMSPDAAVRDFLARIAHYERAYEPVGDDEGSSIRIIDVGERVVLTHVKGYLPARLVPLLLGMHVVPRPLFLTRHGESEHNVEGRIGGDSTLSPRGEAYAERLAAFLQAEQWRSQSALTVWTSTLRRTIRTAEQIAPSTVAWRALDEIDAGECDGLTYAEIKERLPHEYQARHRDKLRYRYPRGESYEDVIQRLDPVVIALERQRQPLLVVAHQAVLRALYAYLMGVPTAEVPSLPIPLHTVIKITPNAYGCEEERFELGPAPSRPHNESMLPPPAR